EYVRRGGCVSIHTECTTSAATSTTSPTASSITNPSTSISGVYEAASVDRRPVQFAPAEPYDSTCGIQKTTSSITRRTPCATGAGTAACPPTARARSSNGSTSAA